MMCLFRCMMMYVYYWLEEKVMCWVRLVCGLVLLYSGMVLVGDVWLLWFE